MNFVNTISNNLIQYFGDNSSHALKFIRNLVKNINNSRNLINTFDIKEKSYGYTIGIYSISGLYNNPKELMILPNKNYYLRYFINIYNTQTSQQYGNTYRSPLLNIIIHEDNSIELKDKNAFFVYVLSQEPLVENLVVQIVLVETTPDKVILKEKCLGWALLRLKKKSKNENENEKQNDKNDEQNIDDKVVLEVSPIYRGTPRELIFKNNILEYGQATMSYYPYIYPRLKLINYLMPNNIILGYNDPLPGLRERNLPQFPNVNENIRTVAFGTAYIKNIKIEINPTLEDDIMQFGREYRLKKYNIEENQFNKVFIKERKIKCGVHNTWKFINSNGLQNSMTLTKILKNCLESNGVLMVDKFFVDRLSCSAIIMQLEYVVTVPINGTQKEDNLSLVLGYHIYVPESINVGNYYKEKLLMVTGPGPTIYGEKMWYPTNLENQEIIISYLVSQNANLLYTSPVEQENNVNKERLNAIEKTIVDRNNQIVLNNMDQKPENLQYISELENRVNSLAKQLQMSEEEKKRQMLKIRQQNLLANTQSQNYEPEIKIIPQPDKSIPQPEKIISKEESYEYQQFLMYKKKKELYDKQMEEKRKEQEEIEVEPCQPTVKNISRRDKSTLVSKGVLDLVLKEPVDSYIDFALEKELCKHGLATIFSFQFLSFKPCKTYYKNLSNVPEKIQFFFDFFNEKKLRTPVCQILKPDSSDSSNYYFCNNPLVLRKENININTTLLNDSNKEVLIEVRYDPSLDSSIDFRDFIRYLLVKSLVVEIKDVQKHFNVGCIKIPLRDLIAHEKDKVQLTKEYEIYDDEFNLRGIIQLLITSTKFNTVRPFSYNRNLYKKINSKDGYNTLSKKKVVKSDQMDVKKLMSQNKNLFNYTVTNLNDPNNQNNENNNNLLSETSHRKLRIEPELEKKIRVMRYFSNKNNMGNNINNTNYSLGGNIYEEEKKLNDLRQKQSNEDQFLNTLKTCEQIRAFNRADILSKVSQENHKNVYNISLILGQPVFFNYCVFNDSEGEELCHIIIEKIKKNNNNGTFRERYVNTGNNKIISVLNVPEEWSTIVKKENLIKPNSYNVISDELYMQIKPGETIPLVIKLLSYTENKEEENYSVCIHKRNGQPLYYLSINIKRVFPIYDHIFHYYFPCDNKSQKAIIINPFKNSKTKTMEILKNKYISDTSINLALESDNYNFSFNLSKDNDSYQHDFIIFFYEDEARTRLYLTWKVKVDWVEVFNINGTLGRKTTSLLYIDYDSQLYKESNYDGNNMTLQLFSDHPETIFFPDGYDTPFTIFPNTRAKTKFTLYPKRTDGNMALINCVNVNTRELYKNWLIKYSIGYPEIDQVKKINCIVGIQNIAKYKFLNTLGKKATFTFYSCNDTILEVIDKTISFNVDEKKRIQLLVHERQKVGREEVLLFIFDNNDEYNKTVLFKINFRENYNDFEIN